MARVTTIISVRLTPPQRAYIQSRARKQGGRRMSEVIRNLIDQHRVPHARAGGSSRE